VALLAELRLPTGADKSFLGERGVYLAPRAVIERDVTSDLRVGFEGGYAYRSSPGRYLNLYVGDEISLGLAGSYRLPQIPALSFLKSWAAYGELLASTPSRSPFTVSSSDAMKTPLELLLGLRADVGHDLQATLGGGTGLATRSGFGREGLRFFAMLSYVKLRDERHGDGILDSDGDGIPDSEDRCPMQAGPKEYDGCPDSDGDDVPDPDDKCPDVAGPASNDGCPVGGPLVELQHSKLIIKGAINFDTAKASIKKSSHAVLDEVAQVLKSHPEIKHVRVDGHTDNVGAAAYNLDLSHQRANSVVEYVASKGVDKSRLSAEGFGLTKPVAPNTTALGRAKNRRVEFTVLEK
jgi:outer membrane protein OmpA-like peptidoglycan-associated protein